MTAQRKRIANFFTDKQTLIVYFQEGENYYFKDGGGKPMLSSSQGDIEKAKQEIAQIFKVKTIQRVR
jgi:hypothetical protein